MAINLVSTMKGMPDVIKAGKFYANGEAQGGSAHNAKNNTKVVYCGMVNEDAGEIDLHSEDFKFFDPGFYRYILICITKDLGFPLTKV